ncbi:MAG: DUF4159 domain-containing protein [Chitinophagales bacterium]|nr:DUF4159 domain-containing protein [Chitinophagales bacterium]
MKKLFFLLIIFSAFSLKAQYGFQIGLLKYNGGGDWYANPTSLPNLISFCNKELGTSINPEPETVEVGSPDLFNYPFVHMTGHGNVVFSEQEKDNLKKYLKAGGFLHIDDNYGMDEYIRPILNQLIDNTNLVELPFSHEIYQTAFPFKNGLPKIHEHDDKAPRAYGLIYEGRLVLLYTYETDLGDGWEDERVHHDPENVRLQALKMGANIIKYVFGE